jgi:hypothetical protein
MTMPFAYLATRAAIDATVAANLNAAETYRAEIMGAIWELDSRLDAVGIDRDERRSIRADLIAALLA